MKGRFLRQENGFALVFALLACVVLTVAATSVITYATSNQHSSTISGSSTKASEYAEAGLNSAYSVIIHANTAGSGLNPTAANLLGCTNATGPSNCASPTYICVSFAVSCPSPYTPTAGTAAVYGYFSGTNPQTFLGITVPASTWLIVSTGYGRTEGSTVEGKTSMAEATISPLSSGAVASVWNHVFLTAPLNPNTCQANFPGNNTVLTVPMYVIGNLCLSGNNDYIKETTGQPIDLQIGGKLILSGSGASVGDYGVSPAKAITSGVVVGGCNTTVVTDAGSPCDNGSYRYKVGSKDSFVSQDDPELTDTQVATNYSTFDPGPKHTCQSGTTPAPLADAAFDSSIAANEGSTSPLTLPDVSGSVTSGTAFNLTPSSSYACISKNGTGTGYLIWNAGTSSITVSGITVAAKTLAVNGSVFLDSNLTVTQTATYSGTAVIEVAGTISFTTNNLTFCAVGTSCLFSNWQGSTGNNSMLTLVSLIKNSTSAINFGGNAQTFQGSLWARTSSSMTFSGNSETVEGPLSIGSLDSSVNNASFQPLPVIKSMPVGAPIPPNTSASVSPLKTVG